MCCVSAVRNVLLILQAIIWSIYISLILLQVLAKKTIRASPVNVLIRS